MTKVTEAIHKEKAIQVRYVSLSSGQTDREIIPHTLVDNGLRWHVRGYDRKHSQFRDCVLTKIKQVELIDSPMISEDEFASQDERWNRFVEVEFIAHPRIKHKETIELDYAMQDGIIRVALRAAKAGYLLRLWNVDCSNDKVLHGSEYHLALRNLEGLYGIESIFIAPGFRS